MEIAYLDHVNVRTANLEALSGFYQNVLGLAKGPRPPLRSAGAWLYCGDRAVVHLVELPEPATVDEVRIEHFAFRAEGLAEFVARLRRVEVAFETSLVPGLDNRQVFVRDPDGNRVEIVFRASEEADLSS